MVTMIQTLTGEMRDFESDQVEDRLCAGWVVKGTEQEPAPYVKVDKRRKVV
jgi:hypothetical protein